VAAELAWRPAVGAAVAAVVAAAAAAGIILLWRWDCLNYWREKDDLVRD